ncbi:MAG: L,D-transpeptidase [Verrucomicrobiota bacterium]
MKSSRRLLLPALVFLLMGGTPFSRAEKFTQGREEKPLTPELKAGDYVWKPEISPAGPVVVIVSLREQTLYVYRNGIRIGRSTISSGKAGHRTPTGVFTILEKNVKHYSSLYKGASMPYQERLTWGGIAMHAGQLPGYPASHGCVRLPYDFARKLYAVTSRGSTVIVTDGKASSGTTSRPGLLLSDKAGKNAPPPARGTFVWKPEKAPKGPVSILFSRADGAAYVYRNGVEIGRAAVTVGGDVSGSHVYAALATVNSDGSHDWQALGSADGSRSPNLKALSKTLSIPPEFLAQARAVVTPGTTLVITDQPVNGSTRSAPGFNILTAGAPAK